ncbi:MAG: tRNA uridine-5-carboxymethylaminomethyl(34) synthesis GTPase MnmE [Synergistaceae bacterium]|nr:tRNA uridine-5-carboxymethylaminomethyl(34) synthesis GTPase MnmE [Synergistaceae bacterium]
MVESTIAAISTALGEGGIAIVRVSGPDAVKISTRILQRKNFEIPGKLYLTSLIDDDGNILDRVLAVMFKAPRSYTGEDIVEIHTHGGIFIARLCLEMLLKNGAEAAKPGEFTRRAFTNGRIDLSQAEGVLGVIHAQSLEALKASARTLNGGLSKVIQKIHAKILDIQANFEINLDFPEGEIFNAGFDSSFEISQAVHELENLLSRCEAGMIFNNGVKLSIIGRPNVGKSSLLNALLGKNRAIVTEIPGTTRDVISETILINSLPVILSDTAGIRETENLIEAEGVRLAISAANESDLCLFVVDGSKKISNEELNFINSISDRAIAVINKSDLTQVADFDLDVQKIKVSAKNGTGIDELKTAIFNAAIKTPAAGSELNASAAQLQDLRESLSSLREALDLSLKDSESDLIAGLLNAARVSLMRVLGLEVGDELLDHMFSRFCVGK